MRKYVMTARRKAALKKAQLASARKRRQSRTNSWKNMKARRKARTPAQKRAIRKELRRSVGKPLAKGLAYEGVKYGVLRGISKKNPGLGMALRFGSGAAELGFSVRALKKSSRTKKKKRR